MNVVTRTIKRFFTFDENLGWMLMGSAVGLLLNAWQPISLSSVAVIGILGFCLTVYCRIKEKT